MEDEESESDTDNKADESTEPDTEALENDVFNEGHHDSEGEANEQLCQQLVLAPLGARGLPPTSTERFFIGESEKWTPSRLKQLRSSNASCNKGGSSEDRSSEGEGGGSSGITSEEKEKMFQKYLDEALAEGKAMRERAVAKLKAGKWAKT